MADPDLPLLAGYLDELRAHLGDATRAVDEILAEADDHLREAIGRALSSGQSPAAAQHLAIERFGPAETVALEFLRVYAQPRVFDARAGLPELAVNELARATAVGLAQRAADLAVLGYWVPDARAANPAGSRFGAILLHSFSRLAPDLPPILLQHVAGNKEWSTRLVANLRSGMHLLAQCWEGEWRLWYSGPPRMHSPNLPNQAPVLLPSHAPTPRNRNPRRDLECLRLGRV